MAGDLNNPGLTDTYSNWPTFLKNLFTDLLKMDGSTTNLPTGTIRWSAANSRFEIWSGAAWGPLAARMTQDVTSVLAKVPSYDADPHAIALRGVDGRLAGDILGSAASARTSLGARAGYGSFTFNGTVYQAATDLIVEVRVFTGAGAYNGVFDIYVSAANPPPAVTSTFICPPNASASCIFAVKKGEFYKGIVSGGSSWSINSVSTIPLGTG